MAHGVKLRDKLHKSIGMHAKLTPDALWVTSEQLNNPVLPR